MLHDSHHYRQHSTAVIFGSSSHPGARMNAANLRYWIPTALFALALTGSGLMGLTSPPEFVAELGRLGFPDWFGRWLGAAKLVGVAVLLAPGLGLLKEWATAGFVITLCSAFVAHLAAGDAVQQAIAPVVLLGLLMASWHGRPAARRLGRRTDLLAEGSGPAMSAA